MDYNILPKYAQDFLNYLELRNLSKLTIKNYYYDLICFFNYFSNNVDIKTIQLSELYVYLLKYSNYKNSSRRRKTACLRSFFKYLHLKARFIDINITQELEYPKPIKRLPVHLSLQESKILLTNSSNNLMDYTILALFLNSGLRLSELRNLNINNISNGNITIIGKGNKERNIPMNLLVSDTLAKYLLERNQIKTIDSALFISSRKTRISDDTIQRIIKKYIIKSGLDPKVYSVHKLRHTAATLMYKYGQVDILILKDLLGHESIITTKVYTHIDNQSIRKAVDSHPLNKKDS